MLFDCCDCLLVSPSELEDFTRDIVGKQKEELRHSFGASLLLSDNEGLRSARVRTGGRSDRSDGGLDE